jgi:hypothetical protein
MKTRVFAAVVLAAAVACALPAAGEEEYKWFCNQEGKYVCRPFSYIYNDNRWCAEVCADVGFGARAHTHTEGSNTLTATAKSPQGQSGTKCLGNPSPG